MSSPEEQFPQLQTQIQQMISAQEATQGFLARLVKENEDLKAKVVQVESDLVAARAAAASVTSASAGHGAGGGPTSATPGVDIRQIGKPESFHGEKWKDWSVVLGAYASVCHPELQKLMTHAQTMKTPALNATLPPIEHVNGSKQLYFILIMLSLHLIARYSFSFFAFVYACADFSYKIRKVVYRLDRI